MIKNILLLGFAIVWFCGCQSKEERLKLALRKNLRTYIQHQNLNSNGSVNIDECAVLDVDTLSEIQMDSVLLLKIRQQRAFYDSIADDRLKMGNLYNHLAYSYQKSHDTAAFNLAIFNATESHYLAGLFIDSSMALQRADDLVKQKLKTEADTTMFFKAKVFVRATFFNNRDSTKVHDTSFYHFTKAAQVFDINQEVSKFVKYDWEE